jgi:hypothetical protein
LGAGVTSETFFAISAVMRNSAGMPHSSTIPKTLKSLTQSALTGILVAVSLLIRAKQRWHCPRKDHNTIHSCC